MSRSARKLSLSKIYHIMCKGIDGQDIFYDSQDKSNYLKKIENLKDSFSCKIFAYCLMSNHVHLVMQIEDTDLSRFMQSLNIRYTSYFNKKYNRSGHFFQDRFKSKCVENQKYFLDVCRYVHQNPEKAGICQTKDYHWSSYHEYIGKEKIVDKHILLHYFNENIDDFKKFTLLENSDNQFDFLEFELETNFTDEGLKDFIVKKFKINNINEISKFNDEELEKVVEIFKNMQYTSLSQIARVTRISRWNLKMIKEKIDEI